MKSRNKMGVSTHIKVGDFVKAKPMAFIRFEKFTMDEQWIGQVVQDTPLCVEFRGETINEFPGRWCLSCMSEESLHPSRSTLPDTGRVAIIMGEDDLVKVKRPKGWGK